MSLYQNPKLGLTYMYYWKDGKRVKDTDMPLYYKKFEDPNYRVIKQQAVNWFRISTIWLGINHSFTGHGIIIFETMVFCRIPVIEITIDRKERKIKIGRTFSCSLDQHRYSTLKQARAGHRIFVKEYSNPLKNFREHFKQHFENFFTIA